jgi:nitrite reductase (NO-forming)
LCEYLGINIDNDSVSLKRFSLYFRFCCTACCATALLWVGGCSRSDKAPNAGENATTSQLPVEYALLLPAPGVPGAVGRRTPAHVIVDLEVREVVKHLASGVDYTFWTFGGSVPGLFVRVRVGDLVEIRLHNHPTSKLPHNIDMHAVIGPGGGAASTITAPGRTSTFSFTALHPGLFVYHCGTAPVPMHVANGMYGLILVEPKGGLPPVDHEFYVMQGEVYTSGRYGETGLQAFDPDKADDERPAYVVFNGAVGAIAGENALKANVGETVRIFFGNGGPNLTSSFHVIGEILDEVLGDGAESISGRHVQTISVAPGSAAIVELKVPVPGTFVLVDHALSRAFGKGALGMLKVSGPEDTAIYSGKISDTEYGGTAPEIVAAHSTPRLGTPSAAIVQEDEDLPGVVPTVEVRKERGRRTYLLACFACHQPDGRGLAGIFPPLAGSDFLKADKTRAIKIPINGLNGTVVVNGKTFNNIMPPQAFTDRQIADVLTYVMNSWGNDFGTVSTDEVRLAHESVR